MLDELKGAALLDGARGSTRVSRAAIVDALLKIGGEDGLILREDAIAEIDVNPMIATAAGAVAVDARVIVRRATDTAGALAKRPRDDLPALERFRPLLRPRTVAVVGASATTPTIGNTFIRRMQAFGYPGAIYPIHPGATHIEALPAYPSLGETPEPVDYAYVAIGAERVPGLLAAAAGNVAFAQVITSGFREEGNAELEDRLVDAAHAARMRLVGPNCLGTYSPRDRSLTFPVDAPHGVGAYRHRHPERRPRHRHHQARAVEGARSFRAGDGGQLRRRGTRGPRRVLPRRRSDRRDRALPGGRRRRAALLRSAARRGAAEAGGGASRRALRPRARRRDVAHRGARGRRPRLGTRSRRRRRSPWSTPWTSSSMR